MAAISSGIALSTKTMTALPPVQPTKPIMIVIESGKNDSAQSNFA
jgi:hypothetical protein